MGAVLREELPWLQMKSEAQHKEHSLKTMCLVDEVEMVPREDFFRELRDSQAMQVEEPWGDWDLVGHCMFAMSDQLVLGKEQPKEVCGHNGECVLEHSVCTDVRPEVQESSSKTDKAEKPGCVEDGRVTVNRRSKQRRLADDRVENTKQEEVTKPDTRRLPNNWW